MPKFSSPHLSLEINLIQNRSGLGRNRMRILHTRNWRIVANFAVSIAVFSFFLFRFGSADLFHRLAKTDLPFICLAILIVASLSILHLARWRLALRQLGAHIRPLNGLRLLFVGYFFNQTLPSSVGGDFFRIWLTSRAGVPLRSSLASVFADRLSALLGLFTLCIALTPFVSDILGAQIAMQITAACLLLLGMAGLLIVHGASISRLFVSYKLFRHLVDILRGVKSIFGQIVPVAKLLALSMLIHFLSGFAVFLIAKSVSVQIPAMTCIVLFPFISLAAVLPISFAGWGIRESAAIIAFGLVGVSPEDSLSISVLLGIVLAIIGIPGGVFVVIQNACNRT